MKLWPRVRLKPRPEKDWRVPDQEVMTSQQAAYLLGVSDGTMRGWRVQQKRGEVIFDAYPPFEEPSRGQIVYRREVLKDWLMLTLRSSCVNPKPMDNWPQRDDEALTPDRAARLLGVTEETLNGWRDAQKAAALTPTVWFQSYPPWEMEDGRVVYNSGALKQWITSYCTREPVVWWEVFE